MVIDNDKLDVLLLNIVNRSLYTGDVMFSFFYTLYHTGLRFNDLYDITRMNIQNNIVSVYPSKNNNERIIHIDNFHPHAICFIENRINYYYQFATYRTFTRLFNRLSGNMQFTVKSKPATLHLFRHNYIRKLHFRENKTLSEIQEHLGLKSLDIVSDHVYGEIKNSSIIKRADSKPTNP